MAPENSIGVWMYIDEVTKVVAREYSERKDSAMTSEGVPKLSLNASTSLQIAAFLKSDADMPDRPFFAKLRS